MEEKGRAEFYLDTLALRQADPGLVLTDNEDVGFTGSERVVDSILDVDDVEATIVTLTVGHDTDTTHVTTTSHHADDSGVEFDEIGDFASREIDLDCVVDFDGGIGITDPKTRKISDFILRTQIASSSTGQVGDSIQGFLSFPCRNRFSLSLSATLSVIYFSFFFSFFQESKPQLGPTAE